MQRHYHGSLIFPFAIHILFPWQHSVLSYAIVIGGIKIVFSQYGKVHDKEHLVLVAVLFLQKIYVFISLMCLELIIILHVWIKIFHDR